MSPMQSYFSDLVCQPLVTSYVINAYLCLAMLHAWTLEYQHMMLCVWRWIPTKAERPAGDRRVALATSGSARFRRMPTLYYYLRCGDLRSPGVTRRIDGNSNFFTWRRRRWWWWRMTDLCQKWRVKLIFKAPTGCPEPGMLNVWKTLT